MPRLRLVALSLLVALPSCGDDTDSDRSGADSGGTREAGVNWFGGPSGGGGTGGAGGGGGAGGAGGATGAGGAGGSEAGSSPPPDGQNQAGPLARDAHVGPPDAAQPPPPPPRGCGARTAALVAATGRTLNVAPAGDGQVTVDGATRTLREVVSSAAEGDTILLADGTYLLPEAASGRYSGLYFTTPRVTLRGQSGNAAAVILDSAYRDHGGSTAPVTIDAPGVVVANLTIRRSIFHLVHLWAHADGAVLHDLHALDGGQQFVKASPEGGETVDAVEVSCSTFRMTAEGRTNVWGYGPSDGYTTCYTGGVDTHGARSWSIHDSVFEGIHCDAGGPPRPAHGRYSGDRGGMTYTGGLAEHAIHMWESPAGSGHVIERNRIVDCARGIGIGLNDEVYGTTIRNNTVFSRHAGSAEHDVPITVERGHDVQIDNNTVFLASPAGYASAIEIRFGSSANVSVRNNLANRAIRLRDGADASLGINVLDADAGWFVDAAHGDLHLAACDRPSVVGAGEVLASVTEDLDGEPRGGANDVGADDCAAD